MTREREADEFEGIDISGPWGGVRIGSGGVRGYRGDWGDDDDDVRRIRRRVRQRLDAIKHLATFVAVVGFLAILDGATGGDLWVQWVAIIWGAFLGYQLLATFIAPALWGREIEERMVRREVERRRGTSTVVDQGPDPAAGD